MHVIFPALCTYGIPFDALDEGDPLELSRVHIWYRKTRTAELQSSEGCMMIDSVVWAQYINMTEHRQPRRYGKCHPNAPRQAAKIALCYVKFNKIR